MRRARNVRRRRKSPEATWTKVSDRASRVLCMPGFHHLVAARVALVGHFVCNQASVDTGLQEPNAVGYGRRSEIDDRVSNQVS